MATEVRTLPPGSVLVHIGPFKTGTTALQASLAGQRSDLLEHGVLYPGTGRRQAREVFALLGVSLPGMREPVPEDWDALVEEVRHAQVPRVVLSSEDFASVDPAQATRAVRDLGGDAVHVLVVARNLRQLLPSAWQERVKSVVETHSYDEFLHEVLAERPEGQTARTFWRHHQLRHLLGVWTSAVPPERITVVVADESDRGQLRSVCEELLGLPPGLLNEGEFANTSLTWDRVELYRALNLRQQSGRWDDRRHWRLVHGALLGGLVSVPRAGEESSIPPLSRWAATRVAELSEERVRELADSGVQVVGDPSRLLAPPLGDEVEIPAPPKRVPIDAAVAGLEGLLTGLARRRRLPGG